MLQIQGHITKGLMILSNLLDGSIEVPDTKECMHDHLVFWREITDPTTIRQKNCNFLIIILDIIPFSNPESVDKCEREMIKMTY
jgi:hypothetical protein